MSTRTFIFTIPFGSRVGEADPAQVVMRELTYEESLVAARAAGGDRYRIVHEGVMISLIGEVSAAEFAEAARSGRAAQPVIFDVTRRESEVAYKRYSAKVRLHLVTAYNNIHSTDDEDDKSFLASGKSFGS